MKSDYLDITIGIPVLNGIGDIDVCLVSLYLSAKDINPSFEVIVVDDGSTGGTYNMITERFPKVQLTRNDENRGVSYSMDYIIENIKGDYLSRLDSDTIVNAQAINEIYRFMKDHPGVGAYTVQLVGTDGEKQMNIEMHHKKPGEWFFDFALWIKKLTHKFINLQSYTKPTKIAYMSTGAALVDRDSIQQVGTFDENIPFFMEDADWIVRIGKLGKKIYFLPYVTIIHVGGQSGYLYIQTRGRSLKSLTAFNAKHYPGFMNKVFLHTSIIFGSFVGLVMAVIVLPLALFNSKIRKIIFRAIRSYSNVFVWYIARQYSTS